MRAGGQVLTREVPRPERSAPGETPRPFFHRHTDDANVVNTDVRMCIVLQRSSKLEQLAARVLARSPDIEDILVIGRVGSTDAAIGGQRIWQSLESEAATCVVSTRNLRSSEPCAVSKIVQRARRQGILSNACPWACQPATIQDCGAACSNSQCSLLVG